GNRAELTEFREMLVAIRGSVAALKTKGLSLEDTIKARPTAAFDAKWGQFVIDPSLFTRLVYEGVGPPQDHTCASDHLHCRSWRLERRGQEMQRGAQFSAVAGGTERDSYRAARGSPNHRGGT